MSEIETAMAEQIAKLEQERDALKAKATSLEQENEMLRDELASR